MNSQAAAVSHGRKQSSRLKLNAASFALVLLCALAAYSKASQI